MKRKFYVSGDVKDGGLLFYSVPTVDGPCSHHILAESKDEAIQVFKDYAAAKNLPLRRIHINTDDTPIKVDVIDV